MMISRITAPVATPWLGLSIGSVIQITGARDRRVQQARFYVLRKTSIPAVLVEVGLMSDSEDAARLSDGNFQNPMTAAISPGILQYLQNNP